MANVDKHTRVAISKGDGEEVDVIQAGSYYRLGVDSNVSSLPTVSLERFKPKFYNSNTDIALSQSNDTELFNQNVDGKLDAISVNFTRDDVEFVLEVDGVEILRINLEELGGTSDYNLACNGGEDD